MSVADYIPTTWWTLRKAPSTANTEALLHVKSIESSVNAAVRELNTARVYIGESEVTSTDLSMCAAMLASVNDLLADVMKHCVEWRAELTTTEEPS